MDCLRIQAIGTVLKGGDHMKRYKRMLSALMAAALVLGICVPVSAAEVKSGGGSAIIIAFAI